MTKTNPEAENIFHKSADGAGFNRLRTAQAQRELFAAICQKSHPSAKIYIDQVREYAGVQVVFYRAIHERFEHARIAIFEKTGSAWRNVNDIIAAQG